MLAGTVFPLSHEGQRKMDAVLKIRVLNTKKGKKTIILNTSKYLNTVQNTNFEIHFVIFT